MKEGTRFVAEYNMMATRFIFLRIDKTEPLFPFILEAYEQQKNGVWTPCKFTLEVNNKWFSRKDRIRKITIIK
jgi:hypothetical protein